MFYAKIQVTYKFPGSDTIHEIEGMTDNPDFVQGCIEAENYVKNYHPTAINVKARADLDADS